MHKSPIKLTSHKFKMLLRIIGLEYNEIKKNNPLSNSIQVFTKSKNPI